MKYILLLLFIFNTAGAENLLLPPPPPPSLSGEIRDIMKPGKIMAPSIAQPELNKKSGGWIVRQNNKIFELLIDGEWKKKGDTFEDKTIVSISDKMIVLKDSDGEKKIPLVIELNYKKRNKDE